MSYLHIENLYRPIAQVILLFKECYTLEKVHGSSANVKWNSGVITYFSGGESYERFKALFDESALVAAFNALGHDEVTVYGEVYGGKCQGMKATYGESLRFIAFDVMVGDTWLSVPNMDDVATKLGMEVVPWRKVSTDLTILDAERDRPSEVAIRRGCGDDKLREGIVIRPLHEFFTNNGNRVIAKHKGATFSETKSPRPVVDPSKLAVLTEAQAIADEWTTDQRLRHVLQKMDPDVDMKATPQVIAAMIEDIYREGKGEIVESREAKTAIGRKTAEMFKALLQKKLSEIQS